MPTFVQRRPVLAFWLLALAIAAAVVTQGVIRLALEPRSAGALSEMVAAILGAGGYTNIVTIAGKAVHDPSLAAILVFAAAPTLAALILAWRGSGQQLASLLSRLRPVGPNGGTRRALALYGGLLVVYAIGFGVYDFVAGPGVDPYARIRHFGIGLVPGAALALFLDEGGTLEELGWRGFAFPLLQDSMRTPLLAALLVGVAHWAWHLPREVFTVLSGMPLANWATVQLIFLLLCVALAVIAGYCVNAAGGSVWPAIFVHGGSNVWSKALGEHALPSFGVLDLRTVLVVLIAIVVLLAAGRQLGHRAHAERSTVAVR